MKKASWILTALLAVVLFPTASAPELGIHLSSRFLDSAKETGMSPVFAVLADYRGFDLFLLAWLGLGAGLLGLLASLFRLPQARLKPTALLALGLAALACAVVLAAGLLTLLGGSNFLDFEPFARFTRPEQARSLGAWILCGACLLGLAGAFLPVAGAAPKE